MTCRSLIPLSLLLCLPACTIQPPSSPVREAFTFGFSTAAELQAMGEKDRQVKERRPAPYRRICIEWNEQVTVPDLLRVLEDGLRRRGVESGVYAAGTLPAACPVLRYAARRGWDQDLAYLDYATLALSENGNVVASVVYEPTRLGFDKWASTEAKLIFLLDQLLFAHSGPR